MTEAQVPKEVHVLRLQSTGVTMSVQLPPLLAGEYLHVPCELQDLALHCLAVSAFLQLPCVVEATT